MKQLQKVYTIKKPGPPSYLLGFDVTRRDNYWTLGSKTYVKAALERIEKLFGCIAKERIPMTAGDHPELDESELLDHQDKEFYQMLIGMARWVIHLGRIDIMFALSCLDRFSAAPRQGHFDRLIKVWGYLKKFPSREFCVNPNKFLVDDEVKEVSNWTEQYPYAKEDIPPDRPNSYGPSIKITCFVDSDHAHEKKNRRSVTGFIICLNGMPLIWYCKRQGSVEASTYGAEFVALRTAVEHLKGLRISLMQLGVNIDGACDVFGDNLSVITHSEEPSSTLKKKHLSIAFHLVRESVAAGIIDVYHCDSGENPANPLTKAVPGPDLKVVEETFFYDHRQKY